MEKAIIILRVSTKTQSEKEQLNIFDSYSAE